MNLRVTELSLLDFRNFERRDFCLSPTVSVLVGPNARGKTNTVEALEIVTAGYSFRRPTPAELVRQGKERARVSARLEGQGRVIDIACDISPGRRVFSRNGKHIQASEVPENLMSVVFTPDDLAIVKRGAHARRDELDDFGRQANRGYANILSAYQRALEQRNRLLRQEDIDLALLDAWDESVAAGGGALLSARLRLFLRLTGRITEIYCDISGGEKLECIYVSSLSEGCVGQDRSEITKALLGKLKESRQEDLRRQRTNIGPHRDDIVFLIDGRDARAFGSQGQQRTIALALKMAEVEVAKDVVGTSPLLLLDDVMSELDASRRSAAALHALHETQTVITTTNLGYFSKELLDTAEVVEF